VDNVKANDSNLNKVVENGYCIGCGACAVQDLSVRIKENSFGLFQARLNNQTHGETSSVCPFANEIDEDILAQDLYSKDSHFEKSVGFYKEIYSGFVLDGDFRTRGSSGGLVTWLLSELLITDQIDAVIHVGELGGQNGLFGYKVSETVGAVQENSKSKYYPVHFDEVLQKIKTKNKRYAFVGVPCFVKSLRLLMKQDKVIQERIKFCFAIFCGHFKTKAFAEMIAWQQNVKPKNLANIDFRVKNNKSSNKYSIQVRKRERGRGVQNLAPIEVQELYGMDWGLGLFKPKACDWCDDIAGETADIAIGDAWLPEYTSDSGGRNILVVRNNILLNLLEKGLENKQLELTREHVSKVYESQAGNYRHRQEGLSVRVKEAVNHGLWYPVKRVKEDSFKVSAKRESIYLLRAQLAQKSQIFFKRAKEKNSFNLFLIKMLPLQIKYYFLNKRLLKHLALYSYQMFKYLIRKIK